MDNLNNHVGFTPTAEAEHPRRLLDKINGRKVAKVAFACLALASTARLAKGTLDNINEQHGGDSSLSSQALDFVQRDFNKWDITRDLYFGNNPDGFGIDEFANIGALVCTLTAVEVARSAASSSRSSRKI